MELSRHPYKAEGGYGQASTDSNILVSYPTGWYTPPPAPSLGNTPPVPGLGTFATWGYWTAANYFAVAILTKPGGSTIGTGNAIPAGQLRPDTWGYVFKGLNLNDIFRIEFQKPVGTTIAYTGYFYADNF
jgi:hypothetical protein